MTLDIGDELDTFSDLAEAVGLTVDGELNGDWFLDPLGDETASPPGLSSVVYSDHQRESLIAFVDEVLGAPDRTSEDGATWVPLFSDSGATVFAVVDTGDGPARVGFGIEYETVGAAPTVALRVHVPVFQLPRSGGTTLADTGSLPDWLVLGAVGGRIDIGAEVVISTESPTAGEAFLGGIAVGVAIPTNPNDSFALDVELERLQLPGTNVPRDVALTVDSLDDIGSDVLEFVVGILQAQADALDPSDPATAPFAALSTLLGLRTSPDLPPFPLDDLLAHGANAAIAWIESIFTNDASRDAWLAALADLIGGTPDASRDAIEFSSGDVTGSIGVRVGAATGGGITITPWIAVALRPRNGSEARLHADVMTADTTDASFVAVPELSAAAVFGRDAGAASDLLDTATARVGSIRTGVVLAAGRPAFSLTAHDCTVNGTPHELLDLSSPDAALDAADTVIGTVLSDLLATFGRPGELVAILIGLDPPSGSPVSVPELLADPVATIRAYWLTLVGDLPDLATVVAAARELLIGAVDPLPGSGSAADPWRIDVDPAEVLVWVDGAELCIDLQVDAGIDFLDDLAAVVAARAAIARLDLATPSACFVTEVRGTLTVQRRDLDTARFDLGPADLVVDRFTVGAAWHARHGLRVVAEAPGAALEVAGDPSTTVDDVIVDVPLPVVESDGSITFDPDWDSVEVALANLLARTGAPVIDALIDLVGWSGVGARLRLADVVDDPAAALRAWLADMVLDCGNARLALTPAAVLLSGGRLGAPSGSGNPFDRFRAPIAGEPLAPGLAAWFEPGCVIPRARYEPAPGFFDTAEPPEPGELVAALHSAATAFPDLADLLVARDGLDQGLAELTVRMVGTDGLVGRPVALPDGVTGIDVESYGYRELVALGATHTIAFEVLDAEPAAVLYLGVEDVWASAFDTASIDARAAASTTTIPATSSGPHSLALPTVEAADADRPDRGGINEQAERIVAALGDRTDPITVIAFGAAGAAAIAAAADQRLGAGVVERIVTVGTPWAPVARAAFTTGLSGDALRFLERVMRPVSDDPDEQLTEELIAGELSPGLQMRLLLERAVAAAGIGSADLGELPDASARELPDDTPVDAVFGLLDADTIERGLAQVVADAIDHRYEQAEPPPPPESLHAGVDLPVLDASIGGVHVGAGITLELVEFDRGASGDSFAIHDEQTVIVDLQFGITDGWLVGGPGAVQDDVEVRWVSTRTWLPLGGSDADARTEIVLHEARCFDVERARWVIDADADGIGDPDVTLTTPEVHILAGEVIARLSSASADLAELFEHAGLRRNGGYDPQGLDRLVLDTALAVRDALDSAPTALAGAIRRIAGFGGSGTELTRTVDAATIQLDLATRSIDVTVAHPAGGLVPIDVTVSADPSGVDVTAHLGRVDPVVGGIALTAGIQTTGTTIAAELSLTHRLPGELNSVELTPENLNAAGLATLAGRLISAALVRGLVEHLRGRIVSEARTALDQILDGLELLTDAPIGGEPGVRVPWAILADPAGWLGRVATPWIADPFAEAVGLLDALRPIAVPTAGSGEAGWPLGPDVTIGYVVTDGRLHLTAAITGDHDLDGADLRTTFAGGISLSPDGLVAPSMTGAVAFDGNGVSIAVDPQLRVDLVRPAPAAPVPILPGGSGLAGLLDTAATMAIPIVLNALIAERDNAAASLRRDVARLVFDLGTGLDLLETDQFTAARITTFAADPVAALLARTGDLVVAVGDDLARAIDPTGAVVTAIDDIAGILRLDFGATAAASVILDATGAVPAIELCGAIAIDDVGTVTVERLRLTTDGAELRVRFVAVPTEVGAGIELVPVAAVRVGVTPAGVDRLIGVGLATDGVGDESVQFRWALDGTPPRIAVVTRTIPDPSDPKQVSETENADLETVATALVSVAGSMAIALALDALDTVGQTVTDVLDGVVFAAGTTTIDPQLFRDLGDPEALLDRAYLLGFNLAAENISLTIDSAVEIGFTSDGNRAGVFVSLAPGQRIDLGSSDPTVAVEVVADWITSTVAPGMSILLVERGGTLADPTFTLDPSVAVAGLGLRVAKTSGPLLDVGVLAIDAIGVHVYGEAAPTGVGAGLHVQLDGVAFTPTAGGGDNAVANNLMSDAADSATPAARPVFSPALAIQSPPGGDLGITFRAGDPPGPWWVVVQRQLGPLYLSQFGIDVTEADGTITGLSLLFDAKVSLFGLSAEVDRLGLHWLGGDVFDLEQWTVDLQGLAISADFSGVSISGGLLRTDLDGQIGYVGMLMGRFGVYGLSLFGGYTDDNGSPSFFVFGAVNGPIGGPPAFFLTGIGGGLGINRGLRVPDDLSQFDEYPFIKALDPAASASEDPLEELRELAEYFPPEAGNFWFAAGISFNSFALVDGIAVVSVSFGTGLEINLFGLARLALPRPEVALVSLEIGLLARFSTEEGLFLIQAQLTDNSWLLYPEVRLTGGFAFAVWWKGENAGQFVLTLGGYHPSFSRPGYPEVPRLGLEWRVTSDIVIKGGSYFALTSEALMAGVDVEVSADFGFVWAKVAFGANAIVYFDPFYFMADAYARISAGLKIKTFLGTIRISISIGARIEVEGPDFHGKATFEIGPCDVSVPFGNTTEHQGEFVTWAEFVPKYLEEVSNGTARAISGITGKGTLPAATGGDTSAPSSDGSLSRPFEVFAEFEIQVVTTVPTTTFDFGADTQPVTPVRSDGSTAALGLSPMNAGDLDSKLVFTLSLADADGKYDDRTSDLAPLVAGMVQDTTGTDGPSFGVDAFPLGVWGQPEDPDQPSQPIPKGEVVFAGNRVKLVATASLDNATGPPIDYYRVESGRRPLPLLATDDTRPQMIAEAAALGIDLQATTVDGALDLAESILFLDRSGTSLAGLVDVGSRSNVGRRAYRQTRNAPPLFGSLAEGIMATGDDNRTPSPMAAPTPSAGRAPRAPFVTGYLASGAGVQLTATTTTVSDGRIKRRPAPGTDSVRGRLGRSLPIKLTPTAAPGVLTDQTINLRGAVPRTAPSTLGSSYRGGQVGSVLGGAVVAGLSARTSGRATPRRGRPRALAPGGRIRPGDVVSMRSPDAAIDVGTARPQLAIGGSARIVMLKGSGAVALDEVVSDGAVAVPPCTSIIAVQADGGGGDLSHDTGITVCGWHDGSQVARLSGRSALAAGCVLTVEGARGRRQLGWTVAGDLVRRAGAVSTRFTDPVRTVGVAFRGAPVERLVEFGVELHGASRVLDGAGAPIDPVVVQAGDLSLLLFEVDDISDRGFSVRARTGGSRQLAAIVGSAESVDHVADVIAERGLLDVVARFRSVAGAGAAVKWVAADDRNRPRDAASVVLPMSVAAPAARPDTTRTGPFAEVEGGRR